MAHISFFASGRPAAGGLPIAEPSTARTAAPCDARATDGVPDPVHTTKYDARQAQIETVLATWRTWWGHSRGFCDHVRRDHISFELSTRDRAHLERAVPGMHRAEQRRVRGLVVAQAALERGDGLPQRLTLDPLRQRVRGTRDV